MMRDDGLQIGDNILVHVGYAIQKVSKLEAAESWELFDQMLAAEG
jgi:hydrogenase expression/formation protein HypC